ncbi:zinc-binding dehydrogenase [Streptomyces sp. NPDC002870]
MRALEEQALAAAVAGRLSPTVQTFELADAAAAHTALESRTTRGKVVLIP